MSTQIFVNLPVADLRASIAFFTRLGFTFNPQFTDETATCMIVSDTIFVMLLTHDKFKSFTPKPISDAKTATEVLVCLSRDSREAVDTMVREAAAAGGATYNTPQDHGFMYGHGFSDLDGHIWELIYMPAPTYSIADCANEAARVIPAGGRIMKPKFSIGEHGFIALLFDTEDNVFGLHSMP